MRICTSSIPPSIPLSIPAHIPPSPSSNVGWSNNDRKISSTWLKYV
jgi:hypothetical protein